VLLTDDIARVAEAIQISRRTMTIARQGIRFGLGLSIVGMAGAAFGFIVPVAGALLQEIIDLAVIVNALRASKAAPTSIAATNREPAAARAAA
jgi:cation transport ATPase